MTTTGGPVMGERGIEWKTVRVSPFWRVLILLIGVFVLTHDGSCIWDRMNGQAGYGDLGFHWEDGGLDGFWRVDAVTPGGPAARLGLRKGDAVRFDRIEGARSVRVGEAVGFTLSRAGARSHEAVTAGPPLARPRALAARSGALLSDGAWLMIGLIGLFVVLRSQWRGSTFLLGAALTCLGSLGTNPSLLESDPRLYPAFVCLSTVVFLAPPVLFLAFAGAARRETSGMALRAWTMLPVAFAAAMTVVGAYGIWVGLTARVLLDGWAAFKVAVAGMDLCYLLTIVLLGLAWRESRGRDRTRYGFMMAAIGLLSASTQVVGTAINLTGNDWSLTNPLVIMHIVGSIAGAGVFAYAVLRHHVLDLGFVVNRTLVYGVLSTLLLVAFGLIEWAVDHFMPRGGRETSAVIDAGVALAVFLTFHRVRDFVEGLVEGVFFRSWQLAEAALRRFVREAAFVTRSERLTQAFATALSQYAEGAQAAVYLRRGDGGAYHRIDGAVAGVGEVLDPDDATLVAIRAEPKVLASGPDASSLQGALIAPMVHRNEVIGLVYLGIKPSGFGYRPDEIEVIGWATQQVGLDLHALKVERLEASETDLRKTVAVLEHALSLKSATT